MSYSALSPVVHGDIALSINTNTKKKLKPLYLISVSGCNILVLVLHLSNLKSSTASVIPKNTRTFSCQGCDSSVRIRPSQEYRLKCLCI